MLENRLRGVMLSGKHPNFLHSHEQPYRYLGVELTITLNWNLQLEAVKLTLQAKASKLNTSMLLPRQKLTYIQNCIRPAVVTFAVCPYDGKGIQVLDNKLTTTAKPAMKLPRSCPTAWFWSPKKEMGIGSLCTLFLMTPNPDSNLDRIYCSIKADFQMEPYLGMLHQGPLRTTLA